MAASVAVHAALLAVLALHAPRLRVPVYASGPPEAVIPVLIMPRTPPPAAAPGAQPQPIRLHRRPQPFALEPLPVTPLVAPTLDAPRPPGPTAPGPRIVSPPTQEDAIAVNAGRALRGKLGCANASLMNLSRAEREACEDQLAAGAKQADYLGTGIDADKAGALAAAARRKDADFRYMRAPGGPGTVGAGPSANGNAVGRDGTLPGATAEGIGKVVGSDKPTLKVPF
ncbi:hypothetical protein [Phenylobacterium sp.]|uniref:hypothetical protein n=1 Tax=Phenylobacterium sp. TaxID=1871053 RepID=UPI0025E48D60|nr:hypothetical protein [Phenylobacterium sp.]